MPSFDAAVFGFTVPYLFLTLIIGVYVSKQVTNVQDFVLAGRSLPFFVTVSSMFSMFFGAEATLGASYNMAVGGLSGDVVADPYGAALCLILYGIFYAQPLYKTNNLTLSDFYVERFGPKVGVMSAVINTIGYLMWTGGQIKGLALIADRTWGVQKDLGSIIMTGLISLYTFRGGMIAVAWTETFESIVIIICLIVATIELGRRTETTFLGAYSTFEEKMEPQVGEAGDYYGPFRAALNFIAMWSYIGIGSIPSQDIYERMNAARSPSYAVFASVVAGCLYIVAAQMPLFIGLVARKEYLMTTCGNVTGCEAADIGSLDEGLILDLMKKHTDDVTNVFFYAAYTSAIMSTSSGTLLAAGVLISMNILRPYYSDSDPSTLLRYSRITTVLFALVAWAFTFAMESISDFVNLSSVWLLVGLFWPLTAGLYWRRATAVGAAMSMVSGVVTYTVVFCLSLSTPMGNDSGGWMLHRVDCLWYAMFVGLVLLIFGSLLPDQVQAAINGAMDASIGRLKVFHARADNVIKVSQQRQEAKLPEVNEHQDGQEEQGKQGEKEDLGEVRASEEKLMVQSGIVPLEPRELMMMAIREFESADRLNV